MNAILVRSYVRARPVNRSELAIMDLFEVPNVRPELFQPRVGHNGGPALNDAHQPRKSRDKVCVDCGVRISPYSRGRCVKCGYKGLVRPVPEDFMAILRLHGSPGAARHYHASLSTITRWRRQIGLRPDARIKKGIGQSRSRGFVERPLISKRDLTVIGQAVDFLRTRGPVFRCDAHGAPAVHGEFWNRGGWVLSDNDILARATRLGWAPVEV